MMEKPIITICIIHYRKLPQLKETIKRLKKYTDFPYQIKIINQEFENKKITNYLNKLKKVDNINVIKNDKNNGCGGGRAQLTKNIITPFVMTLDDDIYVHKNWLNKPLTFLRNNQKVGAVSFPLYSPKGELDGMGGSKLVINNKTKRVTEERLGKNLLEKDRNKFIEIDNPSSGVMLFKKELLDDIKWDPNYFIGFDDLDIGMQLNLNSNYKTFLYTENKFIHDKISKNRSKKEYNKKRRNYHEIRRSYIHFIKKWGYRFTQPRDFFYRYICLLPNSIVQQLVYLWLDK